MLKSSLVLLIFLASFKTVQSEDLKEESIKIATFCKVWGFLKYYHPVVAKGKLDWDKTFKTNVKKIALLTTSTDINTFYLNWIKSLGTIKPCKSCKNEKVDSLDYNFNLKWLNDSSLFNQELIQTLEYIKRNRNHGKNFYVQLNPVGNTNFKNEKIYKDSFFPSPELRLLSLSRYWNIINYFYPYKYKIDQNWNEVLEEMIPKFKYAVDVKAYHLSLSELAAKINDSHASFSSYYSGLYFGHKYPPFSCKIIDNKAIVTGLYNDSLAKINDIQFGDVILKIDNKLIEEIISERSKYIGASNYATLLRNMSYAIFRGASDTFTILYERNGVISEKKINRYYFYRFKYKWHPEITEVWKLYPGQIGYINIGNLKPKNINKVLKKSKDTKALIIDLRTYPKSRVDKISKFLNASKKPFAKMLVPDLSYPGRFYFRKELFCGKENKNNYKGKVILLFNENTQSAAEFHIMALQTAPNVIGIGSQTAGADGNVSLIILPGNNRTYMTGIGVFYPDGKETQRIGIVPDIYVTPSIQGIQLKKDEILDKALQILSTQ